MRFAAAVFFGVLLLGTGVTIAVASPQTDAAGFAIAVPPDWAERPSIEQATVAGFQKNDTDDTDTAFAWSNSDNSVLAVVQAMTSSSQIPAGSYRSNGVAMVKAVAQSIGMTGVQSTIDDDGTVVTGNAEGDLHAMHLVMINQAVVDSTHHLRGYSLACAMRAPVTESARATCSSLLSSFKITLDPSALLPLEPK